MEGGVRVPCIIQWPGTIPADDSITSWTAQTDLVPTFLDAAGVPHPPGMKFDGISILNLLKSKKKIHSSKSKALIRKTPHEIHKRLYLYHRDTDPFDGYDGRINSAGILENLKIITKDRSGYIYKMFDLKKDPLESKNLIKPHSNRLDFNNLSPSNIRENVNLDSSIVSNKCMEANNHTTCSTRYYENNIREALRCYFSLSFDNLQS